MILIGPTMGQIVRGAMSEARNAMSRAPVEFQTLTGSTSQKEIRIDERHWAACLASRNPDTLRGYHASPPVPSDPDDDQLSEQDLEWLEEQGEDDSTRMLILIDEAAAVNPEAYRVLRGMMTKPNVYVVLTGNPMLGVDDDHDFVKAFREGSRYFRIRVSSVPESEVPTPDGIVYDRVFDHVPEYLVAPDEIAAAKRELSSTDPIFVSDWAGTFSTGSSDLRVIPRSALSAAIASAGANLRPLGPRIGVDIGTGRPDMSVASLFFDGVKVADHVFAPTSDDEAGQVTIADTIMQLAAEWGADLEAIAGDDSWPWRSSWDGAPIPGDRVSIDDSGLSGVADVLGSRGFLVDRVNFAKGPEGQWRDLVGTQRCVNIRSEMHWVMRRGLQEGVFIIPEDFRRSWEEAGWTEYRRDFDSIGPVVKLEGKDKVVARHGRSPDTFDADLLACRDTAGARVSTTGAPPLTPTRRQREARRFTDARAAARARAAGKSLLPGGKRIR